MENPVKNELTDYDSKFVAINRVRNLNRLWRNHSDVIADLTSLTYVFSLMRICEIYRLKAKMRTQTELLSIYKYSPPFCVITWLWVTPPRAPKPPPQHHYTSRGTSMRRCTISHNESYKKMSHQKTLRPCIYTMPHFLCDMPSQRSKGHIRSIFWRKFDRNFENLN